MADPTPVPRPAAGALADGTPCHAPVGEIVAEGDLVVCHLCGRWFRSVTAHLRAHGWTKDGYCAAFGLERSQSLEGSATRKRRSAAFSARLVFEPAVRDGSAAGRARARTGALARDAAAAARGRPLPEQRRRKARQALAAIPHASIAEANRSRAVSRIAGLAAAAAGRAGYHAIGDLVRARVAAGASLAAISRELGLHKDWLSRHLPELDPAVAALAAAADRAAGADGRWRSALVPLGYAEVAGYLQDRLAGHRTVNQIAAEIGMSHHAVQSALRRHGLHAMPHAAKRHAAHCREETVAAAMGCASVGEYIASRRSAGWTWSAIAVESGQPQSWLRRHATA
jgi:hypothetical protein